MGKKINSICIISNNYPTESNPAYAFVDQLTCEFADLGIDCTVISPQSITKSIFRKAQKTPNESVRSTKKGNKIKVYRPNFFSVSNTLLKINTAMITYTFFKRSVVKEIVRRNISPDAVYGHFIFTSGMCAADVGKMLNVPAFLAYGESSPQMYQNIKPSVLKEKLASLSGVISVSSHNKRQLMDSKLINDDSMIDIFPNSVDLGKFCRSDKKTAREKLGIDDEKFIIAFVGHYIERKGVRVLSEVLNQLDDVYSFFIGSGPQEPECKNIIFKGRLPHDNIDTYLNAADIFVLPTAAEGCCNAIVEAMACGLPIISSDQSFNDDILDNSNSIRLNVQDENAIRQAIELLKNDPLLRERMAEAALAGASKLSLRQRASDIIKFMESKIISNE